MNKRMKALLKGTLVSIACHFYFLAGIHILWFIQNTSGSYWLRVKGLYSEHWLMILLLTLLVIFAFANATYFKFEDKIMNRIEKIKGNSKN